MSERPAFPFRLPLEYTNGARLKVLYDIAVDDATRVKVIGEPDNGAYEWCIEDSHGLSYSDCGYGIPEVALRDGLTFYWDDSVDIGKVKARAKRNTATQLRAYQSATQL